MDTDGSRAPGTAINEYLCLKQLPELQFNDPGPYGSIIFQTLSTSFSGGYFTLCGCVQMIALEKILCKGHLPYFRWLVLFGIFAQVSCPGGHQLVVGHQLPVGNNEE